MNPWSDLTAASPLHAAHRAIAERLALAFPTTHFRHHVLPPRLTMPAWNRIAQRTPAVALGFQGFRPRKDCGRLLGVVATWVVLGVVRNEAGEERRLLGDAAMPGQIGLLAVAAAALHGMPVAGAGAVEVTSGDNLVIEGLADEHAAPVTLSVTVAATLRPAPPEGSLDEFLRLAAGWVLDPSTGAAADDTINLRGAA